MTTDTQRQHGAKPAKRAYKKPEGAIQAKCIEYMESLGFIVLRTNAGQWQTAQGHYIHGIEDGGADLHCIVWGGLALAVETKAPAKGLRANQQAYRAKVEAKGGTYIACHSAAELRAGLCAAYGPIRVAEWELAGRQQKDAKKARVRELMKKNGQIK